MADQSYFSQTYPTDNAVAVLQNLLYHLKAPISPREVERAVYDHSDFPFISLYNLAELLKTWQIGARPIKFASKMVTQISLPTIAYIEKKQPAFVMLYEWNEKNVTYLHPAHGWVNESREDFNQYWPGVLLDLSIPKVILPLPPFPIAAQRIGIALTLVNAEKTLDSFIRYHLAIGFDHIFLFFDKPDDPALAIADQFEQVSIFKRDNTLGTRWKECRLYSQFGQQLHRPESRQLLNVEIAIQLAVEKQIDWLLQIDMDELFYSPHQSVKEHFSALTQEQVYQCTYLNYEAVSQKVEIEDYFKEVTLFKKSPAHLNQAQLKILRDYTTATTNPTFLAYSNGKSAAKVEKNLLPWGNHYFRLQHGSAVYQKKHILPTTPVNSPIILHYAECGFSHFWNKYKTWGHFPDTFLGGQRIAESVPFRIAARDLVQSCDETAGRLFYETKAVLQDDVLVNALLQEDLLCRITSPANLLCDTSSTIRSA